MSEYMSGKEVYGTPDPQSDKASKLTQGEKTTAKGMKRANAMSRAAAGASDENTSKVGTAMAQGMAIGAKWKGKKQDKASADKKQNKARINGARGMGSVA